MRCRRNIMARDRATSPTTVCRACGHPIRRYDRIGWVDTTPPAKGGLYDFCTSPFGAHVPERVLRS